MSTDPAESVGAFLGQLRAARELVEVDAPVSSDQEIAQIHRCVAAAGGPALLFRNVDGGRIPVATNLFGTSRRAEMAFGLRAEIFVRDAVALVERGMPPGLGTLWGSRNLALQALSLGTRRVPRGPVSEIEEPPALTRIPLLKLWPEDGGHFVTLPLVLTKSPEDGRPNLGIYRMQRYDDQAAGMHWQIGKGGGFHYHQAEARGEALPVTVLLGGPPALILAAVAPLPEGVPEILLASLIGGGRIPVLRRPDLPHEVPAQCELALVGEVPSRERRDEGPFGDHYGYYSLRHPYPVFRAKRLLRRASPILPATVVGKPRQEDFYIGDCLQRLLSPLFPLVMPAVRDLWSYGETGFHSLAAAVVRDRFAREAMVSAFRILGEGQLALTKMLLLVDAPMDLRDFPRVLEHVLARVRWETDLYVFSNLSMDTLDYTGPEVNRGSKGVILGLGEPRRALPRELPGRLPSGIRDARLFCPGCLVLGGAAFEEEKDLPARIAGDAALSGWPLVVLCDRPAEATASSINFLWTTFTRFEPAADIHARSTRLVRAQVVREGPIVIDARMKPWYPGEVAPDPTVAARVRARWSELFPGGGVEMGDGERGHIAPG